MPEDVLLTAEMLSTEFCGELIVYNTQPCIHDERVNYAYRRIGACVQELHCVYGSLAIQLATLDTACKHEVHSCKMSCDICAEV